MEDIVMPTWITSAATAMAFIAVALLSKYWRAPKPLDIPILGAGEVDAGILKKRYMQDAASLLQEGYEKFNNKAFQVITTNGPRLILPRRYAKELISFSSEEVSNKEAISDRFLGEYTHIVSDSKIMHHAIGIDLNKNLGKSLEAVHEEIVYCLDTQLSSACNSDDWTPIKLQEIIQRTVAQASARVFVGYPMCRNDEWRECSTHFARVVFIAAIKLKMCPPWLRPLAQYLITEMWQIHSTFRRANKLIKVECDRRAAEVNGPVNNDMIEWMQQLAREPGAESCNDREFSRLQLLTAMVAIHTTSDSIMHALYDLLARPEYLEPLRAEMAEVFRDQSKPIQKQDLTKLKKLDSFMKESQRHNPPSVATFERKLLIPITLSDGLSIPAGTIVQCNTNILEEAPASWGDPHSFDGFRFSRLREEAESAAATGQIQFVSATYDSMGFSYGREACPGRFFASNLIKMTMTHLLTKYDVKFGESVVGRPKNPMFEVTVMMDSTVEVLAKKRTVSARK